MKESYLCNLDIFSKWSYGYLLTTSVEFRNEIIQRFILFWLIKIYRNAEWILQG